MAAKKIKSLVVVTTAVYIAVLTTLCLMKISVQTPELKVFGFDKVVHFGLYFGLNLLLFLTVVAFLGRVDLWWLILTTILAIGFGVALEFLQKAFGRDFDFYDIVANCIGAFAVALLICCSPCVKGIKKIIL